MIYLTRTNPAKNLARFYRMMIVPDLFGHWVFLREWGRIGSGGQVKEQQFPNEGFALLALQALTRQKIRKGYVRYNS